jgi:ribosome-binding protein aMBF1 (putative translation factor)
MKRSFKSTSSQGRGSSLKSSRKQNSFEKFRESSIKRVKDPKLNEDLDFIFRNEDYGRLVRQQRESQRLSSHTHTHQLQASEPAVSRTPRRSREGLGTIQQVKSEMLLSENRPKGWPREGGRGRQDRSM